MACFGPVLGLFWAWFSGVYRGLLKGPVWGRAQKGLFWACFGACFGPVPKGKRALRLGGYPFGGMPQNRPFLASKQSKSGSRVKPYIWAKSGKDVMGSPKRWVFWPVFGTSHMAKVRGIDWVWPVLACFGPVLALFPTPFWGVPFGGTPKTGPFWLQSSLKVVPFGPKQAQNTQNRPGGPF